ncbi:N-acetylglucosamine-6-phosphate deacetylase [Neokomagataea thailandica NBRC 106555]|uniref:N-acetylglucosamine-6-phosphate deacetylase n=2 Tax=Neokomagataea TaxID=1223423 RepID=A0A4Y6VA09_9PROT|nr:MULTISPECIES: N-acetylglucosamine-6-phosphate deacetylase [Neokomagataea]QDH25195.1 N-acetylglucosamine-6-phosphate deacetylase [Neokomagataea tanensis]GBR53422.1 N-acetylglucosamine-6-phosphate deacetylase [Neokomagataea thailandica NBRC 106555]
MYIDGHILTPSGIQPGQITLRDGLISSFEPKTHVPDRYILPGFIDLHVHGGGGADAMDGANAVTQMARFHLTHGTTTLYPTTITRPWAEVMDALRGIQHVTQYGIPNGPSIPGAHLEGPFINPQRLGAQPPFAIPPSHQELCDIFALNVVRLTTLAPECCSDDAISAMAQQGIRLSIGHTCATCEQCQHMMRTARASGGVIGGTHLFNAMPELRGRDPGPVGALLADEDAFMEIIFDTHHVHPASFAAIRKAAQKRLILITDAMRATGLADGISSLGGQDVLVKDGIARMGADGCGSLAGSVLTLDKALKNACTHGGATLHEASDMLSATPAKYMGLTDRGSLLPGKRADIVSITPDYDIQNIWCAGTQCA